MDLDLRLLLPCLLCTAVACVINEPEVGGTDDPSAGTGDPSTGGSGSGEESGVLDDSSGTDTDDGPPVVDCGVLDEDIVEDVTFAAGCVVQVPALVQVRGQALVTAESGVEFRFGSGAGLEIGVDCADVDCTAGLRVEGTSAAPVRFTSASPSPGPGDWQGLRFGAYVMNATRIEGAVFEYAGSDGGGAVRLEDHEPLQFGRVAIVDSEFRDNAAGGLAADLGDNDEPMSGPFFAELAGNTFSDAPYAVRLDPATVDSLQPGNTFASPIHVEAYWELRREATWHDHGVPYVLLSNLLIASDTGPASLTLEPGVQMLFSPGTELQIGALYAPGALHATEVRFDSAAAARSPGDWDGIYFHRELAPSTIVDCTIAHALGLGEWPENDGVLTMQQGHSEDIMPVVDITGTTFEENAGTLDIFAEIGANGPADCDKYVGAQASNTFDLTPCL